MPVRDREAFAQQASRASVDQMHHNVISSALHSHYMDQHHAFSAHVSQSQLRDLGNTDDTCSTPNTPSQTVHHLVLSHFIEPAAPWGVLRLASYSTARGSCLL